MLRGNKKNGENPSAAQNRRTEIKVQEQIMRHMKKIILRGKSENFTRKNGSAVIIGPPERISRDKWIPGKEKNITRQQVFYRGIKSENWNAALRVLETMKSGYRSKLNSENQNNAATLQKMEIPEIAAGIRNGGDRMKDAADIENIGDNA
jgi:hypothetical protein